jgi:hypothetical protein
LLLLLSQIASITEAADVAGLLAPGSSPPSVRSSPDPQQQQQLPPEHEQQQIQPAAPHLEAPQQQQSLEQHEAGMHQQEETVSHWATPLQQQKQQQEESLFADGQSESSFTTGADSLPVSPTSSLTPPSSSKARTRSQARHEKAAAKAAAKAAKAAAAEQERLAAGLSSPGSSMMSLLQRIKRTMPSIKHRPGSGSGSSCTGGKAVSTASPVKDSPRGSSASCNGPNVSSCATSRPQASAQLFVDSLGSWGHKASHQQQHDVQRQRTTSDSAAGGVSLDDVCLDMGPEHAPEQDAVQAAAQQHVSSPQQQQQLAQAALPADAAAAAAKPAAGRSSTAAQLAATMEQFRQSAQQMQQLWMQLQSLSLDSDEACKLQQMLTPHKAGAAAAAVSPAAVGAASPGPASSSQQRASAEPVQLVKQMVQDEVLQTIYGLHAAVTGMPSSAAGPLMPGKAHIGMCLSMWWVVSQLVWFQSQLLHIYMCRAALGCVSTCPGEYCRQSAPPHKTIHVLA